MSIRYHFVDQVLEGLLRPEVQVRDKASGRTKGVPLEWSKLQNGGSCQFPFFYFSFSLLCLLIYFTHG